MPAQTTNPKRTYRDATFTQHTRDQLFHLGVELEEAFEVISEPPGDLAVRLNYDKARAYHAALVDVIDRWDKNDATELTV